MFTRQCFTLINDSRTHIPPEILPLNPKATWPLVNYAYLLTLSFCLWTMDLSVTKRSCGFSKPNVHVWRVWKNLDRNGQEDGVRNEALKDLLSLLLIRSFFLSSRRQSVIKFGNQFEDRE